MISVAEALERAFALAPAMGPEDRALEEAGGRVMLRPATARRDQPPFDASAMDGYALGPGRAEAGASFTVVGEAAAGTRHDAALAPGTAVRIFTGAPVPDGAQAVVIQEDVTRAGETITLTETVPAGANIRPAGGDFRAGQTVEAPRRLRAADLALLAAMNIARVTVARRPEVAIIATGNELVLPGQTPGPDQIISSNPLALAEIVRAEGGRPRVLPIARDNAASIEFAFSLAEGADLIVTSGGASVGDHDLIGPVARDLGMSQDFYKVAMRPGKPLMAGRLGTAMVLGLPGNPVSSFVCAQVFLRPLLRAMQGLPARPLARGRAALAHDVPANGPREHYMRANLGEGGTIAIAPQQDSSLLSILARADALAVRPPKDPARAAGEMVEYISI